MYTHIAKAAFDRGALTTETFIWLCNAEPDAQRAFLETCEATRAELARYSPAAVASVSAGEVLAPLVEPTEAERIVAAQLSISAMDIARTRAGLPVAPLESSAKAPAAAVSASGATPTARPPVARAALSDAEAAAEVARQLEIDPRDVATARAAYGAAPRDAGE